MEILDCELMLKTLECDYTPLITYHLNDNKPIILTGEQGKCRFCKKSSPGVTFDKVAHAIPNFIGNQHLKSDYECDDCNQLFSRYESQFSGFMKLYHVFTQVNKGGGKVPKYKNSSSEKSNIKCENNGFTIQCFEGEGMDIDLNEQENKVTITGKRSYIPQEVYKALSKMALTIIPYEDLIHFEDTLFWLQGARIEVSNLPLVIRMYRYRFPFISAMVFKRKDGRQGVPAYLFGLAYHNFFLQIPIPLYRENKGEQDKKLTMPYIPTPLDYRKVACIRSVINLSSNEKIKNEPCSMTFGYELLEEAMLPKSEC